MKKKFNVEFCPLKECSETFFWDVSLPVVENKSCCCTDTAEWAELEGDGICEVRPRWLKKKSFNDFFALGVEGEIIFALKVVGNWIWEAFHRVFRRRIFFLNKITREFFLEDILPPWNMLKGDTICKVWPWVFKNIYWFLPPDRMSKKIFWTLAWPLKSWNLADWGASDED